MTVPSIPGFKRDDPESIYDALDAVAEVLRGWGMEGVEPIDLFAHAERHEISSEDEVDGDRLDIDFVPENYTRDKSPSMANRLEDLTAHLKGIDTAVTGIVGTHASTHIRAGSDEVDGDKLDIDWNPSNYTPATTPAEVGNVDELTAHLFGIDQKLAASALLTAIKTVDGTGSGLNADLLDGSHAAAFALVSHAADHKKGGADEIPVEDLPTAADFGYVPAGDGSGGLTMTLGTMPFGHHPTHVTGGVDTIADVVAAGNSGLMGGSDKTILDMLANVRESWNGTILETVTVVVSSDGADWTITVTGPGTSDLTCIFNGAEFILDATPAASIGLTAGTNASPQRNYVYLTESGGTVTLAASTSGWPTEDYCPIADVLLQSAGAPSDVDGPFKVHVYTDHVQDDYTGHLGHFGRKFRSQPADWLSGCAPASMTTSDPDAYLSCALGEVFQLHPHDFPARDMEGGDPAWVTNFSGAANTKITSLDDINADSEGNSINNKYINLVLWGVVSETEADCKLMINLPSGSYVTAAAAQKDANKYANYGIGAAFVGCGFLIGEYILQAKTSGLWVEDSIVDLRGQYPAQSPSGAGITDHGDLSGLAEDDHTQYQKESEKGAADGYAELDGSGDVPDAQIPNLNASKITAGILNEARVPFEAPGAIGGTTPAAIAGTTGAFTGTNVTVTNGSNPYFGVEGTVSLKLRSFGSIGFVGNSSSHVLQLMTAGFGRISLAVNGTQFYPESDSYTSLGLDGKRWSNLFIDAMTCGGASVFGGLINAANLGAATTGTNLLLSAGNEIRPDSSSARYKENIRDLDFDPSLIHFLTPRSFNFKDPGRGRIAGLIAEEVYEVIPQMVNHNSKGEIESIDMKMLTTLLLAEVKTLREKLNGL